MRQGGRNVIDGCATITLNDMHPSKLGARPLEWDLIEFFQARNEIRWVVNETNNPPPKLRQNHPEQLPLMLSTYLQIATKRIGIVS
jgi:hypothetical protein